MIARFLASLIRAYQYFLSPLFGDRCRFHPTCSQYGVESLQAHGTVKGSYLTLKRLCKCQPFHSGGYDPVPEPKAIPTPKKFTG